MQGESEFLKPHVEQVRKDWQFVPLAGLKSAINCDDVKVVAAISIYVNWVYVYLRN